MKLTSKGRYAVTAILDLAFHASGEPVSLPLIASRQSISLNYLEQLFARLRKSGLVASTRGPGGGYRLGKPADRITVAAVVTAAEEQIDNTRCGGSGNCHAGQQCLAHELWDELGGQILDFLDDISLQDLLDTRGAQEVASRQNRQAPQLSEQLAGLTEG